MAKFVIFSMATSLMVGTLFASPAKAIDWNTCNLVRFQYQGGGLDGLMGSAPGLLRDSKVFGSNPSSAECQGYLAHYDSTMLESVAHTGDTFTFFYTGNYLGDSATCRVLVKLNDEIWIEANTDISGANDSGEKWLGFAFDRNLSSTQKNLFASLTDIGDNEFKVTSICPGYEQANVTLTANLKIVQDSFNDFEGVSINDGAEYSNSRNIDINLSFDTGVIGQVMISNDGGFPSSQRQIITYSKNTVPWTLNATRDERMVKTIYVKYKLVDRYTGALASTWSQTIRDDIILDTTNPVIDSVTATEQQISSSSTFAMRSASSLQAIKITLAASDNKSGVSKVQYSTNKGVSGSATKNYSKSINASFSADVATVYVRVKDNAGNWSTWRTVPVVKKFANCKALNKVYPGGVAKSSKSKNKGGKTKYTPKVSSALYEANKSKDRDKDGIVCER